jgi:hypothetical protein
MVETPHHPEWEKLLSAAATRCGKTMVIIYLDPHRREMNKISFKMWVTKQVYEVILGAFAPPPNMSDADRDKLIDLLALGLTASDSEWAEHWAFTTAVQMLKEMGAED